MISSESQARNKLNGMATYSATTMMESQPVLKNHPLKKDKLTSLDISSLPLSLGSVELSATHLKTPGDQPWAKSGRFSTVRMLSTLSQTAGGGPANHSSYRKYLKNGFETQRLGGDHYSSTVEKTASTRFGETTRAYGESGFTLNQVKRERRSKEDDVAKLHIRIRMLEIEEAKVKRKIEETRRKAQSILEVRMNKEVKVKRHSVDRAHTPDIRGTIFQERKIEHQRILGERLSMIVQRRREDATLIKKERRKILRKKSQFQKASL